MNCYYHSSTVQSLSCDRCNRPICLECIIKFKNPKKYRSVDDSDEKGSYLDELNEEVALEDLTWCLPCYYTHFNYNVSKGEKLNTRILSLFVELIAYSFVIFSLLFVGNIEFNLNINFNQIFQPLILLILVVLYVIVFYMLYNYRDKQLKFKRSRLEEVKQKFLASTNVGTIDLPIECFFCKNEIDPESFVCMNLNCTLGEELTKDAKEIPIDPVNSNYGFFNTLKKLPKFQPEEEDKNQPKSDR